MTLEYKYQIKTTSKPVGINIRKHLCPSPWLAGSYPDMSECSSEVFICFKAHDKHPIHAM